MVKAVFCSSIFSMYLAASMSTPAPAGAVSVPEQTLVMVKLLQPLKSGHERKGEKVQFEVSKDVTGAGDAVLIPKGTPVVGTVTRSNGRGMFGKPGKLEFSIDYIKMSETQRVLLRSRPTAVRGRNNTAAAVTTAILLAPLAIFVKGREVSVKEGTEYTVYVDQATEITPTATQIGTSGTPKFDSNRVSLIRFKNGHQIFGNVSGFKDGVYFVVTELGQMSINQDAIESITEKKTRSQSGDKSADQPKS